MGRQTATQEPVMPAGLSIIHSNRMEDLRQVAVEWIRSHPLHPLENELFIVQSNGMAQWLKLALAANDGCGICAAVDIQLPARFLWNAYRAVLAGEDIPTESPYDRVRLVWRLVRMLPSLFEARWFAPLQQYLSDDDDLRKRYQLACQLADLYDQYQVYRADWLEGWARGSNQLVNAKGALADLPPEHIWQAELWRQIQNDVPPEHRGFSRSALHRRFLKAAEAAVPGSVKLPRRVIIFGISSLPKQALEVLHAVSRHSQVLLFVHNPCRHYWADIIEDRELLRIEHARHQRKSKMPESLSLETLHQHVNPLLAAWGKQGRDYIGLLYGYDQPEAYRERFAAIDLFSDFTGEEGCNDLLLQVQQAILDLQPLPGSEEEKSPVWPQDQSITFQLAHSRQREVEILHDQLLSCFAGMTSLAPNDIIVMTPDIDTYAPHIEAVFGNFDPDDARYIPFSIADHPERGSLPLFQAIETLLHLPTSRLTAADLMDLLEVPAFRERFGLGMDALPKLNQWIQGANIRWGLNPDQRKGFDLPGDFDQNSWLFGLRRMLLGYAVGAGAPWQEIEPYDEIGGLDAALVGPLSVILEKLEKYWQALSLPATAKDWGIRIQRLMATFFAPAENPDELTLNRMKTVLEQWLDACSEAGLEEVLPLPVVRQALLGAMQDASVSQRFLAGRVNFCTLMPMRAIPFSVVCLLGMNDGEYPRSKPPLDFDLMSGPGRYRPGDRSRREDDRYLCLEALLSARDKLYISYISRSSQDNSERMPSVLVGQLRDYLAAGWCVADRPQDRLLDQLTDQHPLQPFSPTYFLPDKNARLFTYAHEWRRILDAPPASTVDDDLSPQDMAGGPGLAHLIRFLKNPVSYFYNQRLKIYFEAIGELPQNQEPFWLDNLAPFGPGMVLFNAGLAVDPEESKNAVLQAAKRLRGTGALPVGGIGELAAEQLTDRVLNMLEHHHTLQTQWPKASGVVEIHVPIEIPGCPCVAVEDWLDGLRRPETAPSPALENPHLGRWEFYPKSIKNSKGGVTRPYSLVGLYVRHLAGCAQGLSLDSYLVAPDGTAKLPPVSQREAKSRLHAIANHWWRGLTSPQPVTAKSALAYLAASDPNKGIDAARKVYQGDPSRNNGELGYGDGIYLKRDFPDFNALWDARDNAFASLAEDLYAPLMDLIRKGIAA